MQALPVLQPICCGRNLAQRSTGRCRGFGGTNLRRFRPRPGRGRDWTGRRYRGRRGTGRGRREFGRLDRTTGRANDKPRTYRFAQTAKLSHHSRKADQDQAPGQRADARHNERRAQRELVDGNTESNCGDARCSDRDAQ